MLTSEASHADRLKRAILTTARAMTEFNLPQLMPTLKRLEAERDELAKNGNPLEYAKRLLAA